MADKRRKRGKVSDQSKPGDSPNSAQRPAGSISDFIGCLAGKTKKVATIEEINEAAAAGWAGLVSMDTSVADKKRRSHN